MLRQAQERRKKFRNLRRKFLIIQGEFGKIIDVVRGKFCFLSVYPLRGSLYLREVEIVYKYMLI
jgi:hypothetical protein